jgi:crotonobetaine/carnitine-CoA ligase
MPQMVARRARENGGGVALKHVDGSVLSWEEAYGDSLRWASALERLGVRSGQPVVTVFANGFDAFRAWQGCAWLGAIESPINTNYKGDWLRHVVNNTQAEVVLAEARFAAALFDIADQLTHVKHLVVFGPLDANPQRLPFTVLSAEAFLTGADATERPEPGPWDISSLIYTSGTTGRSKAVMVPWGQLKSSLESGFLPRDRLDGIRIYAPYPIFHITGKGGFYFAAVFGGASVIREAFSVSDYWNDVRTYDANAMVLLGPLAQMLLNQPERADDADNPMTTIAMAPVIPEVDAFSRRFGVDVFTTYNMTEINCPILR